jgi:hypothetical protein
MNTTLPNLTTISSEEVREVLFSSLSLLLPTTRLLLSKFYHCPTASDLSLVICGTTFELPLNLLYSSPSCSASSASALRFNPSLSLSAKRTSPSSPGKSYKTPPVLPTPSRTAVKLHFAYSLSLVLTAFFALSFPQGSADLPARLDHQQSNPHKPSQTPSP